MNYEQELERYNNLLKEVEVKQITLDKKVVDIVYNDLYKGDGWKLDKRDTGYLFYKNESVPYTVLVDATNDTVSINFGLKRVLRLSKEDKRFDAIFNIFCRKEAAERNDKMLKRRIRTTQEEIDSIDKYMRTLELLPSQELSLEIEFAGEPTPPVLLTDVIGTVAETDSREEAAQKQMEAEDFIYDHGIRSWPNLS